jgi:tetratricopeptide (TPR) repeat protein
MGFFDNLKKRRALQKLEHQVESNPTPSNMSTLAERYIHLGQIDKAFEISQQGVEAFPGSEKILRTFRYIKKLQLQSKIRSLNEIIAKNPNPTSYGQLAMIYKDLGETHKAVDICADLTEKFPLSENSYLIIGEIRYQRFHEDLLAKDGQIAIENLEKALDLNSSNYKALLLSAEIYIAIGCLGLAITNLEQILNFAPTDDRVRRLHDEANEMVGDESIDRDEIEWLFVQVENRRQFTNIIRGMDAERIIMPVSAAEEVASYDINEEAVRRQVNRLSKMPGLIGAIAMNRETGSIIADRIVLRVKKEDFDNVIKTIHRVSHDACLRMDVGGFSSGIIQGPFGHLHMLSIEGILLAVLTDNQTKVDLVERSIQDLVPALTNAMTGKR